MVNKMNGSVAKDGHKSEHVVDNQEDRVDQKNDHEEVVIDNEEEGDEDGDEEIDDEEIDDEEIDYKDSNSEESDDEEMDDEEIENDQEIDGERPSRKKRREERSQDKKQRELYGSLWEEIDVSHFKRFDLFFEENEDENVVEEHTIVVCGTEMSFSAEMTSCGVQGRLQAARGIHGSIAARFRIETGKRTVTNYSKLSVTHMRYSQNIMYLDSMELKEMKSSVFRMVVSCKWQSLSHLQGTMSFNAEHNLLANGILQVNEIRFHVFRAELIAKSKEFEKLFLGKKRDEVIQLKGNPTVFHVFLEALHGRNVISDHYVEAVAMFASKFKVQSVLDKCENFLLKDPKWTVVRKFELGKKCGMEKLKEDCIKKMNNVDETLEALSSYKEEVPKDVKKLIEKVCSLAENAKRAKK